MKPTLLALFAGAGGCSTGFSLAGARPVAAVEADFWAARAYAINHPQTWMLQRDIRQVSADELPRTDIVAGGFPCQEWSKANPTRRGLDSARGQLYREMLRVIRNRKPKAFLAENVPGMTTANGGADWRQLLADFTETGYRLTWRLVNFADYGLPQRRKRVIIVGTQKPGYAWPEPTHRGQHITLGETLPAGRQADQQPQGAYTPATSDKPAPTITASDRYHWTEAGRTLTVGELATLQGFPDGYRFWGTGIEQRRQIGNAIPPSGIRPVAEAIIQHIHRSQHR